MTKIDPKEIKRIVAPGCTLLVPHSITSVIKDCITSKNFSAIETERDELEKAYNKQYDKPIRYNYDSNTTIDAYTRYYLPRYTLVPKIAMLYLSYCSAFQELPDKLRVLDLGSGTGAVSLGLLDLFNSSHFPGTSLDITAVDHSAKSLERQEKLIDSWAASRRLPYPEWKSIVADLSDPSDYTVKLTNGNQYDIIFCSSMLTELQESAIDSLLGKAATLLSDNGVIVIAEAQRDYIKKQMVRISRMAQQGLGLHIYYPCPPKSSCPKTPGDSRENWCWMWRKDRFICPGVNSSIASHVTKPLLASWMILCKQPRSIYDVLHDQDESGDATWGIAGHYPRRDQDNSNGDVSECYEICTMKGPKWRYCNISGINRLWIQGDLINRGSIIGYTDVRSEFEIWDVVEGFSQSGERQLHRNLQTSNCN